MAQHYEVKAGEALVINGPANIIVKAGNLPVVGDPGTPPELDVIDPNSAVIGGADLTMTVSGANFTQASVIVFNGGDEVTTFISDTELSTTVKPSLASAPIAVPVHVRTGPAKSEALEFTFTEAGTQRRRR